MDVENDEFVCSVMIGLGSCDEGKDLHEIQVLFFSVSVSLDHFNICKLTHKRSQN